MTEELPKHVQYEIHLLLIYAGVNADEKRVAHYIVTICQLLGDAVIYLPVSGVPGNVPRKQWFDLNIVFSEPANDVPPLEGGTLPNG